METTVNERIKIIRKELKLSQINFADRLKVGQSIISEAERGSKPVTDNLLMRLEKFLGINPDYIMTGKEPMFLKEPKTTRGRSIVEDYQKDIDHEEEEDDDDDDFVFDAKQAYALLWQTIELVKKNSADMAKALHDVTEFAKEAHADKRFYRDILEKAMKEGQLKFAEPKKNLT